MFNVGLKGLLRNGLQGPEFYGDLVYLFRKLIGRNDIYFQFKQITIRYEIIGYNLDVMRQSACSFFNQIMVEIYGAFFN